MDGFVNLVQSLPPELFNKIYTEVFTADTDNKVRDIEDDYKPPRYLSISRASRELFSNSYYSGDVTFRMDTSAAHRGALVNWISSLPKAHLLKINHSQVVYTEYMDTKGWVLLNRSPQYPVEVVRILLRGLESVLSEQGVELRKGVVQWKQIFMSKDGRSFEVVVS